MTEKEKIRNIIELFIAWNGGTEPIDIANIDSAVEFIDSSLQEELVSEELEEEIKNYDKFIKPQGDIETLHNVARYFAQWGAQWQKKQMMAKAIDGYVIEDIEEGNGDFLLSAEYLPKSMGLKNRQKVKVIVIKED